MQKFHLVLSATERAEIRGFQPNFEKFCDKSQTRRRHQKHVDNATCLKLLEPDRDLLNLS